MSREDAGAGKIAGARFRAPLLWLLLCSLPLPASTGTGGKSAPASLRQVADGVYVRPGQTGLLFEADNVANTGVVIGSRCVALIDTGGSLAEGEALDAAVRRLSDLPVCFVINTHVHPDHILGNKAFRRDGVRFIGHEKLPRALAVSGDTWLRRTGESTDPSHIVFPEQTVSGQVELDLGNRILLARAHSSAHTDHDLSVLDLQTGTLFAGDLVFLEHLPVLAGSINGWLDELDQLTSKRLERVVPGHGPAAAEWPAAAEPTVDYLRDLREKARTWIAAGGDLGAAQGGIRPSRPKRWQLIEQYHKRNVAAAFAELEWEE
ncbi:MAG: quinoprotein relay system zinc metallohydrolase 2 [Woeseia sp.]